MEYHEKKVLQIISIDEKEEFQCNIIEQIFIKITKENFPKQMSLRKDTDMQIQEE